MDPTPASETVPGDLLARHPGEAARLLLRAQRDELVHLARLFDRGREAETLDSLRGTTRRMKVTLDAYREVLPRRLHRAIRGPLRELLRATIPARDAQAALRLLERLALPAGPGLSLVEDRFRRRCKRRCRSARREVRRLLPEILRALERELDRYVARVQVVASPTFDSTVRAAIEASSYRLSCAVARPCAADDERAIRRVHKRVRALRHLLEPVLPFSPALAEPILALVELQDRLGAQLDRALLSRQLRKATRRAPARLGAQVAALAGAARDAPAWGEDVPGTWREALAAGALFTAPDTA